MLTEYSVEVRSEDIISRLIAHRGLWFENSHPNSSAALTDALSAGFGIETDLRDYDGKIVVCHDPPLKGSPLFSEMLTEWNDNHLLTGRTLALNVKSDGLLPAMTRLDEILMQSNHFFFDMSFPQLLTYHRAGQPISLRVSEFEPPPIHLIRDLGMDAKYWLDGLESDWWLNNISMQKLSEEAQITIVSPEIHGRDPIPVWDWFLEKQSEGCDLYLCTDRPFEVLDRVS